MIQLTSLVLTVLLQGGPTSPPPGTTPTKPMTPSPAATPGGTAPTATPALSQPNAPVVIPEGALRRDDGRLNQFTMSVTIFQAPLQQPTGQWQLPLIADGPWSMLDPNRFEVAISTPQGTTTEPASQITSKPGRLGDIMLSIDVPTNEGLPISIDVQGVVATWSCEFDDAAAMGLDWPAQWPTAVQPLLQPSPLIESDADIITQTVQRVTNGDVRSVPPVQAAKLLVQYACNNFQPNGSRMLRGLRRQLRGIAVEGAAAAAQAGAGSPADLVCLSVAMLRAAELPARPVIGIAQDRGSRKGEFVTWAEVYLPNCGWVPFDPYELNKRSVNTLDARRAWRYFGNVPNLDQRIPLAWTFAPGNGDTAWDAWALWGWTRLAPGAEFPLDIEHLVINTKNGTLTLQDANTVPTQVNLRRSSLGRASPPDTSMGRRP